MAHGMEAEKSRIQALDGLRAFAIISVMLFHTDAYFPKVNLDFLGVPFQNLIYNGFYGVDLFFVLSGFLITSQLLKTPLTRQNTTNFFFRRFMRIAPAYYVVLLFVTFFIKMQSDFIEESIPLNEIMAKWMPPLFSHLFFLQDYFFRFPPIMNVFWTLAVEIKFYFLCPLFIYLLAKYQNNGTKVLIISSIFIGYILCRYFIFSAHLDTHIMDMNEYLWFVRSKFHTTLDGLIIGGLCAYIHKNENAQKVLQKRYISDLIAISGLILFIVLMLPTQYYEMGRNVTLFEIAVLPVLVALSFGMILLGAVNKSGNSHFLSQPSLIFTAKISYCMYLLHILVLKYTKPLIQSGLLPEGWSTNTIWLFMTIIYFCLTVCFAYLLHRTIERPALEWSKKRWSDKKVTTQS